MTKYIHGYTDRETRRLYEQAELLAHLINDDIQYPPGARVLEAGCGVGAQTAILSQSSPQTIFFSVDISVHSLAKARLNLAQQHQPHIEFQQSDLHKLPFEDNTFDHVYMCFVLEHLPHAGRPALIEIKRVLKPMGTLTVIEGDHGSYFYSPCTDASRKVWQCLIDTQQACGGDALIGRRVYPILAEAGFMNISVKPCVVYGDEHHSMIRHDFALKVIVPMVETCKQHALDMNLVSPSEWQEGIHDLAQVADLPQGVLSYSFFKGTATLPE